MEMAPQSSPVQRHGQLDGKTVTFFYRSLPHGDTDERQLCWADGVTADPDAKWHTINAANVIAVLPINAALPDNPDYSLLYVEEQEAPKANENEAPVLPVLFKSLTATNLPPQFATDFTPSATSSWTLRLQSPSTQGALHVIISTGSGTGLAATFYTSALKPLLAHLHLHETTDYTLHTTSSASSITALAHSTLLPAAQAGQPQSLILLSGDGGVSDLLNALPPAASPRPALTLLPLGTANALHHSTSPRGDATHGLAALLRGSPAPLPTFTATFSPGARLLPTFSPCSTLRGAVVASWGLHATLVADSDSPRYRAHGPARFATAAREALFPPDGSAPHAYRGSVSLLRVCGDDGGGQQQQQRWEALRRREHGYVLASLVRELGAGFAISPRSEALDGGMWVVHFGAVGGEEALGIMELVYRGGSHVGDERVGYEAVEGVRVEFDEPAREERWRRVCVDGRIVEVEEGGWVEVRRGGRAGVDLVCEGV